MTEANIPCLDKKWRYCHIKNGVCANCGLGKTSVPPCGNREFVYCDFKKSKSFPDGVCIQCGKISCSAKTVIDKIHKEIELYSDNIELFVDLGVIISENNVQLTTTEIRSLTDFWYKTSKPTRKRLDEANELFSTLDHANVMLTNPLNVVDRESRVGLKYV